MYMDLKKWGLIALATVGAASPQAVAAKSADQLHCLHEGMTDDNFVAFAETVTVEDPAKRTQPEPDFVKVGMRMSVCANRNRWSDNERFNSIGYSMAYPMARGLRILGEPLGYAALDRYFAANPDKHVREGKLDLTVFDAALEIATGDGLKLDGSKASRDTAARYLDALYAVAKYRSDFEANRFKLPTVR
jgi:hypothetical protein